LCIVSAFSNDTGSNVANIIRSRAKGRLHSRLKLTNKQTCYWTRSASSHFDLFSFPDLLNSMNSQVSPSFGKQHWDWSPGRVRKIQPDFSFPCQTFATTQVLKVICFSLERIDIIAFVLKLDQGALAVAAVVLGRVVEHVQRCDSPRHFG